MNINDDIQSTILLRNSSPLDDFLGLSPIQVHELLYDTYNDKSPVQLSNNIDNETLDKLPLFRIAEEFLKIIQRDKHIKLTPLGALPKKVMVELYNKRFLPDELIEKGITKLWKEEDCISIRSARITAELAGLVKKINGKLSLTKNGTKLLQPENQFKLFKSFFQTFTNKFSWSYNDGYHEQTTAQLGWAFSVYMLTKFGDKPRLVDFYADNYLKAFPKFISFFKGDYTTPHQQFTRCYALRTFDRFLNWFGLVTIEKQNNLLGSDADKVHRTDLLHKVFSVDLS